MKKYTVSSPEIRFTAKQREILQRLNFILKTVESAQEAASALPIDGQPKYDAFLENVQDAVTHIENGMEALPPGLTVEDLTQEAQQFIHRLPG